MPKLDVVSFIDPATTPHPARAAADEPRFGAFRAQWSTLEAIGGLTSRVRLTVITTPVAQQELRREAGEWCRVVAYTDIASLRLRSARTVIHHTGQAFERAPYRIRALLRTVAPVTSGHHSLGYPHLVEAARRLEYERANGGDAIIASSEHGRRVLNEMIAHACPSWPGHVDVVPLPVDMRRPTLEERRRARSELELGRNTVLLLSMGRLSQHDKATLEPLLWAMAELKAEGNAGALLVIAGGDRSGYAAELLRLARLYRVGRSVRVMPDASEEQRVTLLRAADVFVGLYDSKQEVFGLAVAESQAAGVPGVVADYSNAGNIVEDGLTGLTIPTTEVRLPSLHEAWEDLLPWQDEHLLSAQLVAVDRDSLLASLRRLINSPERRTEMGERAAHAARRYGHESVANELADCWERCLGRPPDATGPLARGTSPWSSSDTFAAFSTRIINPSAAVWAPRHRVSVDEMINENLRQVVSADLLLRVAGVLQKNMKRMHLRDVAHITGQPFENVVLASALLHKYGFVTYCGMREGRPSRR